MPEIKMTFKHKLKQKVMILIFISPNKWDEKLRNEGIRKIKGKAALNLLQTNRLHRHIVQFSISLLRSSNQAWETVRKRIFESGALIFLNIKAYEKL